MELRQKGQTWHTEWSIETCNDHMIDNVSKEPHIFVIFLVFFW